MAGTIDAKLEELGITLPTPTVPAANYVPFVVSGNTVYVSGQLPMIGGELLHVGTVGDDITVEQAQEAARACALNIIAHVKSACGGDLDRVTQCLKVGGFVNAIAGFDQQPAVVNGASDLMVEVFGDVGRHARFAVGAGSLPFGVSVEVDAVFEIS